MEMMTFLILAAVLLLNLNGMFCGYGVGWLFKVYKKRSRTLSIEIGVQNAGMGTVLALSNFKPLVAMPTTAFVFICIIFDCEKTGTDKTNKKIKISFCIVSAVRICKTT